MVTPATELTMDTDSKLTSNNSLVQMSFIVFAPNGIYGRICPMKPTGLPRVISKSTSLKPSRRPSRS